MVSFFSILLFTPLFTPIKYVPYVFLILKLKIKFKAKPKAKSKIIKLNFSKTGSPKYNGEWANINDFLTNLLDFKVLCSLDLGLLALVKAINPLGLLY